MQTFLSHFPLDNHTWVFFIVLAIILLAPMLLNKLRIPHIVGMIIAGIMIGQYGFNILERDSSFELFGQVGLYYIMFLAGLEMNMDSLIKNRTRSLVFGLITLLIPLVFTLLSFHYLLGFSIMAALLLGSIMGDHTPVAYSIVGRYGQTSHPTVVISIGSTIVALFISLLILAGISGSFNESSGLNFWLWFGLKFVLYMAFVLVVYPWLTRWFFKHYSDNIMQYIYVLAMIFLSAGLAEEAGLEGIFGAFVAGLVLNKQIPHLSPLMNRIEFVGNALFIPYFLIGVGMLIDLRVLLQGPEVLMIIGLMIVVATGSKWLAAFFTQKLFGFNKTERGMLFGLTNAHAAGALAIILVGTRLEVSPGVFLINEATLNATVILILVSCIIASFATEKAAQKLAVLEKESDKKVTIEKEHFMITYANPQTVEDLTLMAILIHQPQKDNHLVGLHVITDESSRKEAGKTWEHAAQVAASVARIMAPLIKVGTSVSQSMIDAINEQKITDLMLGLHTTKTLSTHFWGELTRALLHNSHRQIMISRSLITPNSLERIVIAVPEKSEYESGFHKWIDRVCNLGEQLSAPLVFHLNPETKNPLCKFISQHHPDISYTMEDMLQWSDLGTVASNLDPNDLFVLITARIGSISYQQEFTRLPIQLDLYFSKNNLLIIFPDQYGSPECISNFYDPQHQLMHVDILPSFFKTQKLE